MEVGGGRRLRILEDLNMLYIRQIAASIQVGILGDPRTSLTPNSGIPWAPPPAPPDRGEPGVLGVPKDGMCSSSQGIHPLRSPPKPREEGGILGGLPLPLFPAGGYL